MERNEIYRRVDHTLLAQTATWEEIRRICDDALEYGTASVCIPAVLRGAGEGISGGPDGGLHSDRFSQRLQYHGGQGV